MRAHSVEPLSTFMDFITVEYMIDNVMLLLKGTLRYEDVYRVGWVGKLDLLWYLMGLVYLSVLFAESFHSFASTGSLPLFP